MKFLKDNWYKLMTGTAMLIFACGFFIYAVSPSYASYNGNSPSNNDYALVPLNKDGSINIKISEEQMSEMTDAQDVVLKGWKSWTSSSSINHFANEELPVEVSNFPY